MQREGDIVAVWMQTVGKLLENLHILLFEKQTNKKSPENTHKMVAITLANMA